MLAVEDQTKLVRLQELMSLTAIQQDQKILQKQINALKKKSGPRGRRGAPGAKGTCGPGDPGIAGNPGRPGRNAGPGRPGLPGKPGKNGRNGRNGRRGRKGRKGAKGWRGRPGLPGKPGLSGLPGKPGVDGRGGPRGPRGVKGKVGHRGRTGRVGVLGHRGRRGVPGRRGRAGPRGGSGHKGKRGYNGRNGHSGRRGKVGHRGSKGKKGFLGIRGRSGPRGRNGRNTLKVHERPHAIGVTIDAATGLVIPGVRITFMQGAAARAACTSGQNGRYYASVEPGDYRAKAVKTGYYPAFRKLSVRGTQISRRDIVMSPKLLYGQSRFVLTWNAPELHLEMFLRDAGGCVVSGVRKRCKASDGGQVTFEQEKCSGHGPQSILVQRWSPVLKPKYYLFVRQTSRFGRLSNGNVVVRFIHAGRITVYRQSRYGKISGPVGKGRNWCVMTIDGRMMKKNKAIKAVKNCAGMPKMTIKRKLRHTLRKIQKDKSKKADKRARPKPKPQRVTKKTPKGVLSGTVISVLNGKPVPYATIVVERDGVKVRELTATRKGAYYTRVPYATYKLRGQKPGHITNVQKVTVASSNTKKDLYLSPKLGPGMIRLVLTWHTTPKDLDSYLQTPGGCTVQYRRRFCRDGRGRADLDLDNTHGKGPETITIRKPKSGVYKYYIRQYSRHGNLVSSSATARVYFPNGKMRMYKVGKFGKLRGRRGRGRIWVVACINAKTGAITNGAAPTCTPPRNVRGRRGSSRRRRSRRRRSRRRRQTVKRKTNIRIRVTPSNKRHKKKIRTNVRVRVGTAKDKRRNNIRIRKARGGQVNQCVSCRDTTTFLKKHDYQGSDLIRGGVRASSPAECCKKCRQNRRCRFWTYGTHNPRKGRCWLKKNSRGSQRQNNRESGRVCHKKNKRRG